MEFILDTIEDDLKFVERVVDNEKEAVDFFLTNFSRPFLEYIGREIMHVNPTMTYDFVKRCYKEVYYMEILGEYYEFISANQWQKLRLFKGKAFCRLETYVNVITVRHFWKLKNKEIKIPSTPNTSNEIKNKKELSDNPIKEEIEVETEISNIFFDNGEVEKELKEQAMKALVDLKGRTKTRKGKKINGEKDYWVLFYSINGYESYDIAEEMKDGLPRPLEEMKRKKVQTRVVQWKQRAINHLVDMILDKENEKKYSELRKQIIRHKNNKKNK